MVGFRTPNIGVWLVLPIVLLQTHVGRPPRTGTPSTQSTPVAPNPNGIPTLVFNCAKLPAICATSTGANALERIGAQTRSAACAAPRSSRSTSTRTSAAKDARRAQRVPGVSEAHARVPRDKPGAAADGAGWRRATTPYGVLPAQAGYNHIANAQGGDSDLIWTCDEWPPAA